LDKWWDSFKRGHDALTQSSQGLAAVTIVRVKGLVRAAVAQIGPPAVPPVRRARQQNIKASLNGRV